MPIINLQARKLPLDYLPVSVVKELDYCLNPLTATVLRDWRGIAEHVGLDGRKVEYIKSIDKKDYDGSNFQYLFYEYLKGKNVEWLLDVLEKLGITDAYRILNTAVIEISQRIAEGKPVIPTEDPGPEEHYNGHVPMDVDKEPATTETLMSKGATFPRSTHRTLSTKEVVSVDGQLETAPYQAKRAFSIFIAYAPEGRLTAYNIVQTLTHQNGKFTPLCIASSKENDSHLQACFQEYNFVVVVISRDYKKEVEKKKTQDSKISMVHQWIREEWQQQPSKILPVFAADNVSYSFFEKKFPKKYVWPRDWKTILFHLSSPSKIVKRYASLNYFSSNVPHMNFSQKEVYYSC